MRPDLDYPARLVCQDVDRDRSGLAQRPALPEGYVIVWDDVETVDQARAEHEAFVSRMIARNSVVSGYITQIEGRLFVCSNNAQFWRDYWDGLAG